MSTKDYKTNREIVVNVKGNVRVEVDAKTKRKGKGSVPPSKGGRRFLKRRVKPSKGINFFDLGQIANGSGGWIDTNYQLPKTVDQAADIIAPPPLITADFDGRDAPLLAIPTGSLATKGRRVTKGSLSSKYSIVAGFASTSDLLDNLDQWTTQGLQLEPADLVDGLTVSSVDPFFDVVRIKDGEANQKITAGPNYAGPAVAFSPAVEMDVFLPPSLVFLRGRASTSNFGDRGDYGELYLTFPRRFIINTNDPYQGGDISPDPATGAGMDADTLAAINNWKAHVPNRGYFYDYLTNTWTGPGEPFPPAGTIGRGIGVQNWLAFMAGPNGALLAIVRKGTSFYYFWTTGF